MKRFAITPLAALGILAGTVPAARAADATCPPTNSGTINGNLVVPAGATCQLESVTVTGNVQVGKGASLRPPVGSPTTVTIGGNVQAARCQQVILDAFSVGGNVQIQHCTAVSGYGLEPGLTTINGNFACDHNSGGCVATVGTVRGNVQVNNNSGGGRPGATVAGNQVGGNVQVNNNSGSSASAVGKNTIGGNLRCARNTPGVTGSGNTVAGTKLGQCAGL